MQLPVPQDEETSAFQLHPAEVQETLPEMQICYENKQKSATVKLICSLDLAAVVTRTRVSQLPLS